MQHVAPVRQQLGFRTIFNLLGPLTNPARAEYQLLGASSNAHAEKLAKAVARLGLMRAIVVCGNNQLDEVSLWGTTQVWDVKGREVQPLSWTPADFKLPECRVEELQVASVAQSADVIRGILSGETSAARDIVLANAAAALYCRGVAGELLEGVELAAQALDNGAAEKLLQRLSAWTGEFR
jgi:anthranilate phosphoribosyltransferase